MNNTFASRLKKLREQHGLSQSELADKLGISRGSISFYENESRVPDINILIDICNLFSVSSDYLIGLSDDPKPLPTASKDTGLSYPAIERLTAWNTRYPDGKKGLNALSRLIVYSDFFHLLSLIQDLFDFAASDGSLKYTQTDLPQSLVDQVKEHGYQPVPNAIFRMSTASDIEHRFGNIVSSIARHEERKRAEQYCKEHGLEYHSTTLEDILKESEYFYRDKL